MNRIEELLLLVLGILLIVRECGMTGSNGEKEEWDGDVYVQICRI